MNTFGIGSKLFQLVDPRSVRANRARFRRDVVPNLDRANSFYCPSGRLPCRGWILLPRYEYVKLDSYSNSFELTVGSMSPFKSLSVVQAQCISRGIEADANALYLIEVTDGRGVLRNKWFQFPVNSQYNIRAPGYPQLYYSGSLNSGTAWTWSGMIGNLWGLMSAFIGTYPGLPTTPSGTPENWVFAGVSAWDALCDVLDHLGMAVACDSTATSPYTIVYKGAADTAFDTLQTKYAGNLEDDLEWIDTGSGRVPKTIVVYFTLRTDQYGQEETVRRDSLQWTSTPLYSISVTAPATFTSATGTHYLHDDFTIRQDLDGVANSADVATATTIASNRVDQYFAKVYGQLLGCMSQTYSSELPFLTGSKVDCISWTQDFSNQRRQGWKTHIYRGCKPIGVWGDE